MAKSIVRAIVKPDILVWARQSAGFDLDEVEKASGLSKIRDWESGELKPTINQLRTLARKYKRPLSVFYLQEVPTNFQVIRDFRRLPGTGMKKVSAKLHLQIRAAQERREIALELLGEMKEQPSSIRIAGTINEDPEVVGSRLREYLAVSSETQRDWKDTREAFNSWRSHIENAGILVFQMDGVETSEASGFALSDTELPVIAVNRADVLSRRTFTLLHETAHLLLKESGISEYYIDVNRPPEEQKIEVWCNAVAAATLFPKDMFLSTSVVRQHQQRQVNWSEDELVELAKIFSASKISVTRRLLTLGLTNQQFYKRKEKEYADAYREFLKTKRAKNKTKEFRGRNMPNEALSLLGKSYIRLVLAPYHSDRITLRDVSAYLNLKTRHIPNVERRILEGAVS